MTLTYEFLIARADEASHEAGCAQLANVRDRALRAESAWRAMAEQVRKIARNRELADRERSARRDSTLV